MASILEAKSGYRIRWRNPDGGAGSFTVTDKAQALRLAAEATLCEREGKPWVPPARRKPEGMDETITEAAARWLAALASKGRAPRTLEAYARGVAGLADSIQAAQRGRVPTVAQLTPAAVTAYLNARRAKVKNPAGDANAIRGFCAFLGRGALREPMEAIREVADAPKAPPRVIRVSFKELDIILGYLGRPGGTGYTFAALARCSGLRAGEILALTWGDLSGLGGEEPTLTIPHSITKGGRSGRVVPVAPVLADYLSQIKPRDAAAGDRIVSGWSSVSGAGHVIHLAISAAVESGELPSVYEVNQSRAHLFRKGFIQGLRALRADHDAVETLVGHALSGVKANYLHQWDAMTEAVALVPPFPETAAGNVIRLHKKAR